MDVVAHYRIGVDAHRKNVAQRQDAARNDGFAVFERLTGQRVSAQSPARRTQGDTQ